MDRPHALEIGGDRVPVGIGELGGAAHHRLHARAHHVRIRCHAGLQQALDLLDAPIADAGLAVRCDVRRVLPVRAADIAGKGEARLERAEQVARRVAFFAMGDGVNEVIAAMPNPPRLWLNASTATIYRHALDRPMDEVTGELGGHEPEAPATWNFSIQVAQDWEKAFLSTPTPRTRKIAMRSAITLSPDHGSVFEVLLNLVRWGLGGTVGTGRQYVSWIHGEDFVRAVDWLIAREDFSGVVNLASPNPLPNEDFMRALRQAWGARMGLPASGLVLELGCLLMRTESELVLKNRRSVPGRLLESGFEFRFPEWPDAVRDLVARWRETAAIRQERR